MTFSFTDCVHYLIVACHPPPKDYLMCRPCSKDISPCMHSHEWMSSSSWQIAATCRGQSQTHARMIADMRVVGTYLLNRDNSGSVWVERNMENQPTHCHPRAKYIGGIQEDEWNVYCHGRACSAQSSPYLGTSTALSSCTEHALKHCPLTTKLGWTRQAQDRSETQTHTNIPMLCKDPSPTYISVISKCNLQRSTQLLVCDTATKELTFLLYTSPEWPRTPWTEWLGP